MQHTSGSGCFYHIKQVTDAWTGFQARFCLHRSGNSYKTFFTCNDADQAACFELQNPNMTSIRLLNCKRSTTDSKGF